MCVECNELTMILLRAATLKLELIMKYRVLQRYVFRIGLESKPTEAYTCHVVCFYNLVIRNYEMRSSSYEMRSRSYQIRSRSYEMRSRSKEM